MIRSRLVDDECLKLPRQGARDLCARLTKCKARAVGKTRLRDECNVEIDAYSRRKSKVRLKTKQDPTDRKTQSDISVSA
jgi:hypothetical protein